MNKHITLFLLLLFHLSSLVIQAQSTLYNEQMKKYTQFFHTTTSHKNLKKLSADFIQIATHTKSEWLPYYYASLCNALVALESSQEDIDVICDKAEGYVRIADSLSKNNSEIYVLKSMIAAARILVDKEKRSQKFGLLSAKYANQSVKLNPDNPRAYLLKAQNVLNAPKAIGGGKEKAIPIFKTALEKFKTFKPTSDIFPQWGKQQIEEGIKQE